MPKSNHKTQVAIYARVSTKDVENQLRELRRWTKIDKNDKIRHF